MVIIIHYYLIMWYVEAVRHFMTNRGMVEKALERLKLPYTSFSELKKESLCWNRWNAHAFFLSGT